MTIFSAAILLFFVMDPIGNIPLFLAALGPVEPARRAWVVGRELFIAYALLVGFLLAGRPLLATLHISEPALTMAGGIVLFLIAIRMTFPAAHGPLGERVEGEPFVVPLAIPYVAGPSALATVLLLTSREPERMGEWFAAVTLAWLASATILLLSQRLARVLGEKGITAVERLMGMVLVASAVQMFLDGLKKALAVVVVGLVLSSAAGARCDEPAAVAEAADADIFAGERVLRLRIRVAPRDEERLREDPRRYVRCVLEEEGGATFRNVAVKLKGAAGSFREFDDRPALTLSLVKFARERTFHGLEKFHLNNSVQDESLALEWLAAGVCRDAGVPAARAAHARVWINDRDLGIYVLKEGFDALFLARHFAAADGNLYDGGFVQDVDAALEKDCGDGPDDGSDLAALVEACREPDPARRHEAVAARLDVDGFLSFMAAELLLGHWDGYTEAANNYRLYVDPADGRARFIAHGMDQILGDPGASILDMPGSIVARAVMDDPEWRAAYRERVRELLPLFDPPEPVLARVAALATRLGPALAEIGPEAVATHAERVRELDERIRARAESLREQAVAPEPVPPEAMAFDAEGTMRLEGWEPRSEADDAVLEQVAAGLAAADEPTHEPDSEPDREPDREPDGAARGGAYAIRCGPSGRCIASWRRRVVLARGDYVLRAVVTTRGVEPLEDEKGRGAGVRISGAGRENAVAGDVERRTLFHGFTVEDDAREVELVAELRAAAGEAVFDAAAFTLHRLGP